MKRKIRVGRILEFIKPEWLFVTVSLLNGLFYVALNSISIWLTASLVNNVLVDFDKMVREYQTILQNPDPTLNDKIKVFANSFILRENNIETLKILCIVIISVFVLKNIFLYLKNLSMSYVQLNIVTKLRNRIYSHIQSLSLSFFQRRKFGDLSSVIINDVGYLNNSIGNTFHKLIVQPINILSFGILLFIISWKLTLVALLIIPFSQFVIQRIGRSIRRKSRRNTKQIGGIMSIITETISSIRIVKAFAMESHEVERFQQESWKFFRLLFRSAKLRHVSTPVIESIGISLAVLLLWLGGSEVMSGNSLSSEDFLRFMFLMFSMLGPIRALSNINITIQNGLASAERIFEVLDEVPEIVEDPDSIEISTFDKEILFDHVRFDYGDESFGLNDINFTIPKGQTVALVGPSGAGKSTIADLIPRFFDVTDGTIYINEIDIRKIKKASLRKLMGIVTQETILMNDTIRSNIIYGNKFVDEDMLLAAAKAANALEFINHLPDGFETVTGERGLKLSGGQRQRIAIARAIYKNPPILILDEATSALDTKSERFVQNALDNLMLNRTVLVIAHRLSTVINANHIMVMDRGCIEESGTHEQLYEKGGMYKDLYDNQFSN